MSDSLVLLGPHTVHERSVAGGRLRLVVPDAATPVVPAEQVTTMDANASRELTFGHGSANATIVMAPSGVPWSNLGVTVGPWTAWVWDNATVTSGHNTWIHEYVHIRTDVPLGEGTFWLSEAVATYYTARVQLRTGRIDYHEFETTALFNPAERADLTDRDDWNYRAEYDYGAMVLGAIDRRVALASDGEHTLTTVLQDYRRRDGDDIDTFLAAVEAAANASTAATAKRWITNQSVPETSSAEVHERAYGEPVPQIRTSLGDVRSVGPTRNDSLSRDRVTIGAGEHLVVEATVSNVGDHVGRYETALDVYEKDENGSLQEVATVDRRTGWFAAESDRTFAYSYHFGTTGTYLVSVDGHAATVTVTEDPQHTATPTTERPTTSKTPMPSTMISTVNDPLETTTRTGTTPPSSVATGGGGQDEAAVTTTSPTASPRVTTDAGGPGFGPLVALGGFLTFLALGRRNR